MSKLGAADTQKLYYVFEEVQRERMDVLLEIQRIGVDALVLDWCRQILILKYHPSLVEPYMQERGFDPRENDSSDPQEYGELVPVSR